MRFRLQNLGAVRPRRFVLMSIVLACAGCGSSDDREPGVPVTGKIVFADDGQPAGAGGQVWFESTLGPEHRRATGTIQKDGTFEVLVKDGAGGVLPGQQRVRIAPETKHGSYNPEVAQSIDSRFFSYDTSGLTADVEPKSKDIGTLQVEKLDPVKAAAMKKAGPQTLDDPVAPGSQAQ